MPVSGVLCAAIIIIIIIIWVVDVTTFKSPLVGCRRCAETIAICRLFVLPAAHTHTHTHTHTTPTPHQRLGRGAVSAIELASAYPPGLYDSACTLRGVVVSCLLSCGMHVARGGAGIMDPGDPIAPLQVLDHGRHPPVVRRS